MSTSIKVDIWSDIACPWCFLGKRRFETAAAEFAASGGEVEIEFHSFELSPDTPADFEGDSVDFLVTRKGMAREQVEQMQAQMTELGTGEGLAYDFEALRQSNTGKAHELLHFAKGKGRQLDMTERLFQAHFEQGRHVGRIDVLADLAAEIGLDRDEALAALTSGVHLPEVAADKAQAAAYGINGVPFFVIDGRFGVSGAQTPAALLEVLQKAAAER